jgi:hypothetical protein
VDESRPGDEFLRRRFRSLRAEDSARMPDFGPMLERARLEAAGDVLVLRPKRRLRWTLLAGTLAAAALAGVMLVASDGGDDFEALVASYTAEVGGGAWRSPTGGLLDVPGIEFLRSVPSIGGPTLMNTTTPERAPSGTNG